MSSTSSGAPPLGRHADAIEVEPIASLLTAMQLKSSTELLFVQQRPQRCRRVRAEPSSDGEVPPPIFDIRAVVETQHVLYLNVRGGLGLRSEPKLFCALNHPHCDRVRAVEHRQSFIGR